MVQCYRGVAGCALAVVTVVSWAAAALAAALMAVPSRRCCPRARGARRAADLLPGPRIRGTSRSSATTGPRLGGLPARLEAAHQVDGPRTRLARAANLSRRCTTARATRSSAPSTSAQNGTPDPGPARRLPESAEPGPGAGRLRGRLPAHRRRAVRDHLRGAAPCPNAQNLIAILGDTNGDRICDVEVQHPDRGHGRRARGRADRRRPREAQHHPRRPRRRHLPQEPDVAVLGLQQHLRPGDERVPDRQRRLALQPRVRDPLVHLRPRHLRELRDLGNGDSGVYPGSGPDAATALPDAHGHVYGIEIRNCDSHDNTHRLLRHGRQRHLGAQQPLPRQRDRPGHATRSRRPPRHAAGPLEVDRQPLLLEQQRHLQRPSGTRTAKHPAERSAIPNDGLPDVPGAAGHRDADRGRRRQHHRRTTTSGTTGAAARCCTGCRPTLRDEPDPRADDDTSGNNTLPGQLHGHAPGEPRRIPTSTTAAARATRTGSTSGGTRRRARTATRTRRDAWTPTRRTATAGAGTSARRRDCSRATRRRCCCRPVPGIDLFRPGNSDKAGVPGAMRDLGSGDEHGSARVRLVHPAARAQLSYAALQGRCSSSRRPCSCSPAAVTTTAARRSPGPLRREVLTPPTSATTASCAGLIRNDTGKTVRVTADDVRVLAADGKRLPTAATFIAGYAHRMFPPTREPRNLPESERERLGDLAVIEPGQQAAVTVSWRPAKQRRPRSNDRLRARKAGGPDANRPATPACSSDSRLPTPDSRPAVESLSEGRRGETMLNEAQRETLQAVCDTVVPRIERADDPTRRLGPQGHRPGRRPRCSRRPSADLPPDQQAGMLQLLDALGAQGFARAARSSRASRSCATSPCSATQAAAGVGALVGMTLFFNYGAPDPQTGQNPNWSAFGYPGPASAPAGRPKPITPLVPDGDELDARGRRVHRRLGRGRRRDRRARSREQGLKVVVLEAGGYFNEADFNQLELWAYQNLYWRGGPQQTADLNVTLQAGAEARRRHGRQLDQLPAHAPVGARGVGRASTGSRDVDGPELRPPPRHGARAHRRPTTSCSRPERAAAAACSEGAERLGWSFAHGRAQHRPDDVQPGAPATSGFGDQSGSKQSTAEDLPARRRRQRRRHRRALLRASACSSRTAGRPASRGRGRILETGRTARVTVRAPQRGGGLRRARVAGAAAALRDRRPGGRRATCACIPCTALFGIYGEDLQAWWGAPHAGLCDEFADIEDGYGFLIEGAQYAPGADRLRAAVHDSGRAQGDDGRSSATAARSSACCATTAAAG